MVIGFVQPAMLITTLARQLASNVNVRSLQNERERGPCRHEERCAKVIGFATLVMLTTLPARRHASSVPSQSNGHQRLCREHLLLYYVPQFLHFEHLLLLHAHQLLHHGLQLLSHDMKNVKVIGAMVTGFATRAMPTTMRARWPVSSAQNQSRALHSQRCEKETGSVQPATGTTMPAKRLALNVQNQNLKQGAMGRHRLHERRCDPHHMSNKHQEVYLTDQVIGYALIATT